MTEFSFLDELSEVSEISELSEEPFSNIKSLLCNGNV